ncbi:MAG: amino acid permease [Planctomycetia bacterium]|nr:amino acid permease [Planctomycetia bacterium]
MNEPLPQPHSASAGAAITPATSPTATGPAATGPAATGPAPAQPSLLRALGLYAAVAVVVGNVIGSGIFLKPGRIAADGGEVWLILSAWVFGGVLCLLGALCYAELAAMLPRAGGEYVFLREAYGRPLAFLFGWNDFLFGKPASIGALSMAFVGSLAAAVGVQKLTGATSAMGAVSVDVLLAVVAVLLIAAMAVVNVLGVVWGGVVQTVTTVVKAGGVALIALAPFVLLLFTGQGIEWENYASHRTPASATGTQTATSTPAQPSASATNPGGANNPSGAAQSASPVGFAARFGLVLLAVMWAYNGWNGIGPVAEEIRDPGRNIPIALLAGVAILIALYVAANVAYHGVLSVDELAAAGDNGASATARALIGPVGAAIVAGIIMCSTFGAINSNLLLGPRVPFAMGRDGVFFRQLGRVHPNFRTPAVSIVVQAAMAAGLVIVSALLKVVLRGVDAKAIKWQRLSDIVSTIQTDSIFTILTNFVIFAASIFYLLGVAAVLVLRYKNPGAHRPYRTFGYPVVPVLFIFVYVWFLMQIYLERPFESLAGFVLIGLGLPVYFLWQQFAANREASR